MRVVVQIKIHKKKQKVAETTQNNTKDNFKCQNIHMKGLINKLEIEWNARYGNNKNFYLYQKKMLWMQQNAFFERN